MKVWIVFIAEVGYHSNIRDVCSSIDAATNYCNEHSEDDAVWEQGRLFLPSGAFYHIEMWDVHDLVSKDIK